MSQSISRAIVAQAALFMSMGLSSFAQQTQSNTNTPSNQSTVIESRNGEARVVIQIEDNRSERRGPPSDGRPYYGPYRPEYIDTYGPPRHVRGEFDHSYDWFERCTTGNQELIRARNRANFHAQFGRLSEAAATIRDAIARVADGDLAVRGRPSPGPHLTFAAREAKSIIETTYSAIGDLTEELRVQVAYIVTHDLVNLLITAYTELDEKYRRNIRNDCGDCWFDGLPREYFDGVRNLALRFVKLQRGLTDVIPSDMVEIKLAKAVSISAVRFLDAYTGRRAYCRALTQLIDLRNWVCDYLDHPSYPAYELTDFIRQTLKRVEAELEISKRDC